MNAWEPEISRLDEERHYFREHCISCNACEIECAFIRKYGKPAQIAETCDPEHPFFRQIAYECSLCGLCTAVCPVGIDPMNLFLEMRRTAAKKMKDELIHKKVPAFEKWGTSKWFTWYALPENCRTVFFPGCTLPGTRPKTTLRLIQYLQSTIPSLGVVLDCCTKPSHDLGLSHQFKQMFSEMAGFLKAHHIDRILTACPNCHEVFEQYGGGFSVQSVYEHLNAHLGKNPVLSGSVVVHDPCPARFREPVTEAARELVRKLGMHIEPMAHEKRNTVCCGAGGAVREISATFPDEWENVRRNEAAGRPVVTYCAGCADALKNSVKAFHILDLLFDPAPSLEKKPGVSSSPMTYFNRLRLKRALKKLLPAPVTRERTFKSNPVICKNLLIADDETDFLLPLAERLTRRGLSVTTAENGRTALERIFKNHPIDVVLLDLELPDVKGVEVLQQIKQHNPLIQVILLTGHSSVQSAIEGMKAGASDYLVKPCDFDLLFSRITKAMEEKQDFEKQLLSTGAIPFITSRSKKTQIAEIMEAAAKKRGNT